MPLLVAPDLVRPVVATGPEPAPVVATSSPKRAPMVATIGDNPGRLAVGLPGVALPVVAPVLPPARGGGVRNGTGRD
jgi:hypothetical protein